MRPYGHGIRLYFSPEPPSVIRKGGSGDLVMALRIAHAVGHRDIGTNICKKNSLLNCGSFLISYGPEYSYLKNINVMIALCSAEVIELC